MICEMPLATFAHAEGVWQCRRLLDYGCRLMANGHRLNAVSVRARGWRAGAALFAVSLHFATRKLHYLTACPRATRNQRRGPIRAPRSSPGTKPFPFWSQSLCGCIIPSFNESDKLGSFAPATTPWPSWLRKALQVRYGRH